MAHKTLIGGTAYEISGGKTLVNGTAYTIKKGKTLINGTAYGINFDPEISIVVNAKKWGDGLFSSAGTVTINGTKYSSSSSNTTLTLPVGTVISCGFGAQALKGASAAPTGMVKVNGAVVAQVTVTIDPNKALSTANKTYDYVVSRNATIELTGEVHSSDASASGNVIITEY